MTEILRGKLSRVPGYVAMKLNASELELPLSRWRSELGELTEELSAHKALRDGEREYHLTAIQPRELRKLRKQGVSIDLPECSVELLAIGSVEEKEADGVKSAEAHYIICRSPEISQLRRELELPDFDLHITLGFRPRDVHSMAKDISTSFLRL